MQIQDQMANVKMKCFSFWMNSQIYGQIPDFNKKLVQFVVDGLALIPILQNLRSV